MYCIVRRPSFSPTLIMANPKLVPCPPPPVPPTPTVVVCWQTEFYFSPPSALLDGAASVRSLVLSAGVGRSSLVAVVVTAERLGGTVDGGLFSGDGGLWNGRRSQKLYFYIFGTGAKHQHAYLGNSFPMPSYSTLELRRGVVFPRCSRGDKAEPK